MYNYTIQVQSIFSNLKRNRAALIIPFDGEKVALGKKNYIYDLPRFIGGGIDEGEQPLMGARREFQEETGLSAELEHIATIEINATAKNSETASLTVYCYTTEIANFQPSDDLVDIVVVPLKRLKVIADKMDKLPNTEFAGRKGSLSWQDWGKLYSPIHRKIYDILSKK